MVTSLASGNLQSRRITILLRFIRAPFSRITTAFCRRDGVQQVRVDGELPGGQGERKFQVASCNSRRSGAAFSDCWSVRSGGISHRMVDADQVVAPFSDTRMLAVIVTPARVNLLTIFHDEFLNPCGTSNTMRYRFRDFDEVLFHDFVRSFPRRWRVAAHLQRMW